MSNYDGRRVADISIPAWSVRTDPNTSVDLGKQRHRTVIVDGESALRHLQVACVVETDT